MSDRPYHRICSVEGRENKHLARGMCDKHYKRSWRSGSVGEFPLTFPRMTKVPGGLNNKRFGTLTVVAFAYIRKSHIYWQCACDCGNLLVVGNTTLLYHRRRLSCEPCRRAAHKLKHRAALARQAAGKSLHLNLQKELSGQSLKRCFVCAKILPFSQFGKLASTKSGRHSYCLSCARNYGRAYRQLQRRRDPEKLRTKDRVGETRRRAIAVGAVGKFTAIDWRDLVARSPVCFWCGRSWTKQRRPTHDHIIPLVDKGPNSPENSVCACSRCNSSKGRRRFNPMNGQGILI